MPADDQHTAAHCPAASIRARWRPDNECRCYEFSVLGDFDAGGVDLFRVLYERVQLGLAVRHAERGELGWRITDAGQLVGRITWDPDRAGEVPLLVIDGRPSRGISRPDVDVSRASRFGLS